MGVGSLEEIIDDNHAIVSSAVGAEYYVSICSFVDKDSLEPGSSVLLHNKVLNVVGILADDVDPMVSVMKVDKAPLESYASIGGLESQIQEIKEAVELPLTHPELYEDIGIKPPKVRALRLLDTFLFTLADSERSDLHYPFCLDRELFYTESLELARRYSPKLWPTARLQPSYE
mmetsp:Transcript_16244/g.67224  ORF Transcript_16244/g.67224 Transcript_16244/m.67224 type:complete len:174 (+) Transcript_16244:628-1149(+)